VQNKYSVTTIHFLISCPLTATKLYCVVSLSPCLSIITDGNKSTTYFRHKPHGNTKIQPSFSQEEITIICKLTQSSPTEPLSATHFHCLFCFRPFFVIILLNIPTAHQFLIIRTLPFPRNGLNAYVIITRLRATVAYSSPKRTSKCMGTSMWRQPSRMCTATRMPVKNTRDANCPVRHSSVFTANPYLTGQSIQGLELSCWGLRPVTGEICSFRRRGCAILGTVWPSTWGKHGQSVEMILPFAAEIKNRWNFAPPHVVRGYVGDSRTEGNL
jgi:hypothetical protein